MQNVKRNVITLVTNFNKFSRAFYFITISSYLLKLWLSYEYEWFSVNMCDFLLQWKGHWHLAPEEKKRVSGQGLMSIWNFPGLIKMSGDFPGW